MKLYEMLYVTLTGRECRASITANNGEEATDLALDGLAKEGIKVVTHEGASWITTAKTFNVAPTLLRLDTN